PAAQNFSIVCHDWDWIRDNSWDSCLFLFRCWKLAVGCWLLDPLSGDWMLDVRIHQCSSVVKFFFATKPATFIRKLPKTVDSSNAHPNQKERPDTPPPTMHSHHHHQELSRGQCEEPKPIDH